MMKKVDLRVKRTHKMIIEAFIRLVEERGYDDLTVQEIADEAMINRATFYAHFKNKQDLYDSIFHLTMNVFVSVLDPDQIVKGNRLKLKQVEFVLTNIYQQIKENKVFFITILESSDDQRLRKQIQAILEVQYAHIFSRLKITENDLEVPIDFIIEYITSIFFATLHWWITADTTMDANSLAKLVIKLVSNGHLTVLGIEVDH